MTWYVHAHYNNIIALKQPDATTEISFQNLYLRNPVTLESADDITTLTYLHEPALLANLQMRYNRQLIYTYTGSILIAVNPYQKLDESMYGKGTIEMYRGQQLGRLSPHVYAIAEDAYRFVRVFTLEKTNTFQYLQ